MSTPMETIMSDPAAATLPADLQDEATLAESGFYWRERGEIKMLVCKPLEEAGYVNGFSTRLGGVSPFPENSLNLAGFNEDAAENIYENRRRFMDLFPGDHSLALAWQIHSDKVRVVETTKDVGDSEIRSDAVISDLPNVLAGVKTADCVPVLVGDRQTGAYAAIHAGWRGTVRSIAAKAIGEMTRRFDSRPGDLVAAMGPAACGRNYEIGQDVMDEFAKEFGQDADRYFTPTRPGHALVNLHAANRDQLVGLGLDPVNIYTAPLCTIERTDLFFSYRIEKARFGKTGRLLSVIGRAT